MQDKGRQEKEQKNMYFREPPLWTTPNRRAQQTVVRCLFYSSVYQRDEFQDLHQSDTTIQATRLIKRKAIKVVNNE